MRVRVPATVENLQLISSYNREHSVPTWVIHTPPESTIGGFSARFVKFVDSETVIIKIANGDLWEKPLSEISFATKVHPDDMVS